MGEKKCLLWKVARNGITHHIFGTMHLQYDVIRWPQKDVLALIDDTEVYYGEMNLDPTSDFSYSNYFLPNQKTFPEYISTKKYAKLRKILLKAFGVDVERYKNMYPIFLQYQIDTLIASNIQNISMDEFLWKYAQSSGRKVGGLESRIDQLNILHQLPIEFQLKNILAIANNVKSYRRNIRRMIQSYENGSIRNLKKKALRSMGNYKNLMIYQRNEKMAARINELPIPAFITFGAGHLGGNKGVLALLKRHGWKISAVKT